MHPVQLGRLGADFPKQERNFAHEDYDDCARRRDDGRACHYHNYVRRRASRGSHGLSADEIVAAYLNRNTRGYKPLLEVLQNRGAQRFQLMCGDGVYAVVRAVEG